MNKSVLKWNLIFQYGWVLTNVFNSLLLLPFYIKNIDATTLGVWLASSGILNWMTMVDPGVGEVLQQKIAELLGNDDRDEIGKSIGSGLIASIMIVLIAAFVGVIFYFTLGYFINKDVSKYPHLQLALLITIFATGLSLMSFTLTGINQGLHNSAQVAISSLSANFLFLIINFIFLFLGFGVLSIAIANLTRALFTNLYIFISMQKLLKRKSISILISKLHFKSFIKIFSFTSASKIIAGLSYSIDMVVLARYIAPGMITIYEINKRPLNLTNTLIGRHSVALMPLISHEKGKNNNLAINAIISNQFKFYLYGALFVSCMFALNYSNLITLWVGEGKFIGNSILYLLVVYNFVGLICYFMSNVGFALGDIKKNSKFNIIRNLFYGVLIVIAARQFGIIGTVAVSLAMSLVVDLFFFSYRVYTLGYLETSFIKHMCSLFFIIVPSSIIICSLLTSVTNSFVLPQSYLVKLIINSIAFSSFFVLLLLAIDSKLRNIVKYFFNKYIGGVALRK